jgi:putative aminopeptidase FrvX
MKEAMTIERDLIEKLFHMRTYSGCEEAMVQWIINAVHTRLPGCSVQRDEIGNILVTRGPGPWPMVCCHTDTVFKEPPKEVVWIGSTATGLGETGRPCGLGADDKCGIYACLKLLESHDNIKAAFFVGEEIYCIGSKAAPEEWFKGVQYAIEYDSPGIDTVSISNDGTMLSDPDGEFWRIVHPQLVGFGITNFAHHPWTDTAIVRRRTGVACINLPAAYYYYHTKHETMDINELHRSIELGSNLIGLLGNHTEYR